MGGELLRPRGHPRDLGIPGDSQGSPGTFRDPWESPSASLDPLEIAIHNSLACGFHHGTYVPLSHWYQRLEASTSPPASGSSNVVGAGRVGCGKAGWLEANQVGALLCLVLDISRRFANAADLVNILEHNTMINVYIAPKYSQTLAKNQ